jgi:hypothetical protein
LAVEEQNPAGGFFPGRENIRGGGRAGLGIGGGEKPEDEDKSCRDERKKDEAHPAEIRTGFHGLDHDTLLAGNHDRAALAFQSLSRDSRNVSLWSFRDCFGSDGIGRSGGECVGATVAIILPNRSV